MASFLFGSRDAFTELVERATSEDIPAGSDDIMLNLEVADKIKGKDVAPDKAMRAIKARLDHRNPNVQLLTLKLAEICVKNGGNHFLQQISSREFMDQLDSMLKQPTLNYDVRNKTLALIQSWALSFRSKPELSYVVDTYNRMRNLGYGFPPPDKTDSMAAMFDTATAPEWTDSDVCERCRVAFTFTNRKHHCRNCGKTFCGSCSAKSEPLPHFAITKPVRVCDGCWARLQSSSAAAVSAAASSGPLPPPPSTYGYPGNAPTPVGLPDPRIAAYQNAAHSAVNRMGASKEDEDLARAIALSLEETKGSRPSATASSAPPAPSRSKEDEDLERAIAESLKDLESKRAAASENVEAALKTTGGGGAYTYDSSPSLPATDPNELNPTEAENIRLFAQLVERLEQEAATRGASNVISDSSVQNLYNQIAALQPKLVKNVTESSQKYRAFADINTRIEGAMKTYDMMLQARLREAAYGPSASSGYRRESYTSIPSYAGASTDYSGYAYPSAAPGPASAAAYPQPSYQPAAEASAHVGGAYPSVEPYQSGPPQAAGYYGAPPPAGASYEQHPAPAPYAAPPQPYPPQEPVGQSYGQPQYSSQPPPQPVAQVPAAPPPQPVEEKPLIEF